MATMNYDIFISYRRDGGSKYARILKAELEKRGYADRVFLDYDGLKDGRFDSRIMQAIDSAGVFIFILSPGALDRCRYEDDWVRKEIVYALEHERHIIPVNFDNLFNGFPSDIPTKIHEALGQHQFSKIDSESLLDASMEKLIRDRIAPIVSPVAFQGPSGVAEIIVVSDADCEIRLFGKRLATVPADIPTPLRLKKGNYLLEFISTESPEAVEKQRYSVPDNDFVDYIEVSLKEKVRIYNRKLRGFQNKDGKWGYMDETGTVVIPCVYERGWHFSDGLAPVKTETGWGFIDKAGKIIIPCRYGDLDHFSDGLAPVKTETGWGFIDKAGKIVISCMYNAAQSFSEGLAFVRTRRGMEGFIDKTGKFVICLGSSIYRRVSPFSEGLAMVSPLMKCGFIDRTGNMVIPYAYKNAGSFSEGFAMVESEKGCGFIDKSGKIVIPCIYQAAGWFRDGKAEVKTKEGRWCYINKAGKEITV